MTEMAETSDFLWMVVASALVMIMQAGFCFLESGLVRAKNSINVGIKNLVDYGAATLIYWAVGFALMFGASQGGWIGSSDFFVSDEPGPWKWAFFLFQMTFCGTAATIVSGAVAERMRFSSYLIVTCIVSGLIYPIFGHWAWGGTVPGTEPGWLAERGFLDFAGSTVVHSCAGWVSLAAVLIIGPREGRFDEDKPAIEGHNVVMATFGVLLLWFGWFGFNGGSTLGMSTEIPLILVNTNLSAAAGGITALGLSRARNGRFEVTVAMNGVIAGLVAVTACCAYIEPPAAVAVGSIAGVFCTLVTQLMNRLRIDDVIGAVPAHAVAGAWGTLAVALLGAPEKWGTGFDRIDQLAIQATGIATCMVWAFGAGFSLLWITNHFFPLRVCLDDERIGLNVSEHGANTSVLQLVRQMGEHGTDSGNRSPVDVDPHTEVGVIAAQFNNVVSKIAAEEEQIRLLTADLIEAHTQVKLILDSAAEGIYGVDLEGRATFVNPSAAEMLGWEADELIGELQHDLIHHTHADGTPYPVDECPIYAAFRDGSLTSVRDEVFWKRDGESFPVEYVSTPIRTEVGDVVGAVVTFRDLTERRSLEMQLVQAQKLESIGQLAAGIAHEINTPSQYVGDNVDFLKDSFADLATLLEKYRALHAAAAEGVVTPELVSDVTRVAEAADLDFLQEEIPKALLQSEEGIGRVSKIVRAMKEFSHPGVESKLRVNLNSAIESTLMVATSEWKYVASVETELESGLPLVPCLASEFNQVVLNIVVNAAHAIEESREGDDKGTIRIRTSLEDENWVAIEISDDGTGMPESVQQKIFDPFYTTKEVGKGTGQGLAIAHSVIVDKHGGTIAVTSAPGEGTTFLIRMPLESD